MGYGKLILKKKHPSKVYTSNLKRLEWNSFKLKMVLWLVGLSIFILIYLPVILKFSIVSSFYFDNFGGNHYIMRSVWQPTLDLL